MAFFSVSLLLPGAFLDLIDDALRLFDESIMMVVDGDDEMVEGNDSNTRYANCRSNDMKLRKANLV